MNKYLIFILLFLGACRDSTTVSRPQLTVEEFDRESVAMKGVIMKFIQDNDPATVHAVSVAVQSTFAVACIPVGAECKQYNTIVTKIIELTQNHKFSVEQKMEVLKLYYQMEETLQASRVRLIDDWKKYAP